MGENSQHSPQHQRLTTQYAGTRVLFATDGLKTEHTAGVCYYSLLLQPKAFPLLFHLVLLFVSSTFYVSSISKKASHGRHCHLLHICTIAMSTAEMSEHQLSLYISYYWWLLQALSYHKHLYINASQAKFQGRKKEFNHQFFCFVITLPNLLSSALKLMKYGIVPMLKGLSSTQSEHSVFFVLLQMLRSSMIQKCQGELEG